MPTDSNLVEMRTGRTVSSYGGVGSIFETTDGAILIEESQKWPFCESSQHWETENHVNDQRLVAHLRAHFESLEFVFRVPVNSYDYQYGLQEKSALISGRFFPAWMHCSSCKRFKPLAEWYKKWHHALHERPPDNRREAFSPPRCYHCYQQAKRKGDRRKYYDLEQVRFVLTSRAGNISDVPWEKWLVAGRASQQDDGDGASRPYLVCDRPCCDDPDLRYYSSGSTSDLGGIRIYCASCEKSKDLYGFFSRHIKLEGEWPPYKPVIRSSNSVYYAQTLSSIFIPFVELSPSEKEKVRQLDERENTVSEIQEILSVTESRDVTAAQVSEALEEPGERSPEKEVEFRRREYQFFADRGPYEHEEDHLRFDYQDTEVLSGLHVETLARVSRLKLTTVQTSYTRQEPIDRDYYLADDDDLQSQQHSSLPLERNYTSKYGKHAKCLPGVERYGEGFFVEVAQDEIVDWFACHWQNTPSFTERIEKLAENYRRKEFNLNPERFDGPEHLARFVLLHTFAHVLIKELEFICGYPATSLSERLYVDGNQMQGLLIYAVAGAEGSHGGLVSQTRPARMKKIVESALVRAQDCASDPVCYYSDGQGVANLNLAACYSCALLPEPSCEEFNLFLDRRLLVDQKFGFWKSVSV
jgi:hypothetical protein